MVEQETKHSALLQFVKEHGEKAVLGIVVAAVAAYLFLGWNGRNLDAEQVENRIEELERKLREGGRGAVPSFYPGPRLPGVVVYEGEPGDDWSASLLPKLVPEATVVYVRPELPLRLPEVGLAANIDSPYAVKLIWMFRPFEAKDQRKEEYIKLVNPESFTLERAVRGSRAFVLLKAGMAPDQLEYTDEGVEPERQYDYRLTAMGKDKKRKVVKIVELSAPVTIPGIWSVKFHGPNVNGAYVEIGKVDRKYGDVVVKHYHKVGDRIGWWAKRDGDDATSVHYISKPGNPVPVDFNTGITLVSIEGVKVDLDVLQCGKRVEDSSVVHFDKQVKRPFSTYRIILRKDGVETEQFQPAVAGKDERCRMHRGK